MDIPLLIALNNTLTLTQMNTPIRKNYYPIHEACRIGNLEAVKQMVHNVDVNSLSPIGTPIMIAAKGMYLDIIELLLSIIPTNEIFKKDETGKIWLHYLALHSKTTSTHTLLIKKTTYLLVMDSHHESPLDIIKKNYINTEEYNRFISLLNNRLPRIFANCGHGCDTGYEAIVPPNCTYVTLSVCGNSIQNRYVKRFHSIHPFILSYPIKNKQQIEKMIGHPIQIYTEGNIYSNVKYETFSDFCKEINLVSQSGIHNVYFLEQMNPTYCTDPNVKEKIYKFSIIPKITELSNDMSTWNTYIFQSHLFHQIPNSIFYNISCRGACKGFEDKVQLRRKKSITLREDEKRVITLEQLRELYPNVEESKEEKLQESKEEEKLQESKDDHDVTKLRNYIQNPHLYLKGSKTIILSELSKFFPELDLESILERRIIGGKKTKSKNKKKSI